MSKRSRLLGLAAAVVALGVVVLLFALRGERDLGPALDSAEKPAQPASTETKRASSASKEEASSASEEPPSTESPAPETPASTSDSSGESEGAEASEKPLYTVEGEVLDQRTDELVPAIHVTLVAGKVREMLLTDERGRFRSTVGFPVGPIAVEVADDGVSVASVELEVAGEGTSWTLPVPIGPTYPVRIEGDAELARFPAGTWKARIVETVRPDDPPAGLIDVTEDGELRLPDPADELPDRAWPWRRLRAGELPWLRYAEVHHPPDGRYRVMLELRGLEAGVAGRGEGFGTVGIRDEVSVLPRDPVASVEGYVSSAGSGPMGLATRRLVPRVFLVPADPDARTLEAPPMWYEEVTEPRGGYFAFEGVLPGRWRLAAFAPSHVVLVKELELSPGPTRLETLHLERGQHTTLSLHYLPQQPGTAIELEAYRLRLRDVAEYARAWFGWASYNSSGRFVNDWGLPEGAYLLECVAHRGPPRWGPYRLELERPVEAEGVLRPFLREETLVHRIEAVDEVTGEDLSGFTVLFGPEGSMEDRTGRPGPWRLPADAPLQWSVWKDSYAPAFGTHRDFETVEGERAARVSLRRGWGTELLVRAADPPALPADRYPWPSPQSARPGNVDFFGAMAVPRLPGVRVLDGGSELGRSDEEGAVRLSLDHRPKRLELRAPGWRLVALGRWTDGSRKTPAWILWMDRR